MPRPVHIACLQTRPMPTMETALAEALPMAEAAVNAGAQMLFLPEYCGGLVSDGTRLRPPSAKASLHPVLDALRNFASKRKVWMQIGSIAVDGADGNYINRGYCLDTGGNIAASYDKIHLFDADIADGASYRESDTVTPGDAASVVSTPHGTLGLAICYDLRFPGLFRDLAQAGADILCCPAAFTKMTGEAHWHVLNRARAIENTAFVVSACAVGPVPGGGESYGHSLVVGPWGDVIADGGHIPGVVHAQIDLDDVAATSARIPSLHHDRPYTLGNPSKRNVA